MIRNPKALFASVLLPLSMTACTSGGEEDVGDEVDTTTDAETTDAETTDAETTDAETTDAETTDATETSPLDCADPNDPGAPVIAIQGDINADETWTCDNIYILAPDTLVFVNGATLTIEPGVTVKGNNGSALIIEKDSMLMAEGTADAPIVMTSAQDTKAPGDWGGLVLLGEAVVNLAGGSGQAEGFPVPPSYGGDNAGHNCGSLAYLRVEYAGFAISEGNELNGITFYACGSGTSMHHVQSHMGSDDGIEMFGGSFDADHIVVSGANDDSIDMDQGFGGTLQHVFIHQDPGVGDNCFEVSNQGADFTAQPLTSPTVCNATCVGSGAGGDKSKGITIKEGTEGSWFATIITNVTGAAAVLADEDTFAVADAGGVEMINNIFFGNGDPQFVSNAMSLDGAGFEAWVFDAANANLTSDPGLASAAWGDPDPTPSGDVAGNGDGCGGTSYIGAVDPAGDNWTAEGWINYTP